MHQQLSLHAYAPSRYHSRSSLDSRYPGWAVLCPPRCHCRSECFFGLKKNGPKHKTDNTSIVWPGPLEWGAGWGYLPLWESVILCDTLDTYLCETAAVHLIRVCKTRDSPAFSSSPASLSSSSWSELTKKQKILSHDLHPPWDFFSFLPPALNPGNTKGASI